MQDCWNGGFPHAEDRRHGHYTCGLRISHGQRGGALLQGSRTGARDDLRMSESKDPWKLLRFFKNVGCDRNVGDFLTNDNII